MGSRLFAHWKDVPPGYWRWPNFSPEEIACRGSGELLVDEEAMDHLQALRTRLGKPLIVNSAYRSAAHNTKIGGAPNSQHMQGKAFDVSMANHQPHAFEAAARAAGFTGIGTYPRPAENFVHVDIGPARTWGDAFPPDAPAFAPEPPPARDSLVESRTMKGAGLTGSAVTAAAIVNEMKDQIEPLLPYAEGLKTVLLVLGLVGVALTVYARWDDFRKGKR